MQILIADDDRLYLEVVAEALRSLKVNFTQTTDGAEAYALLSGPDAPPIAILDWEMPGLTGVEICRRLRQKPPRLAPYLMLLTARISEEEFAFGIEAGASDFIRKTHFNKVELYGRLHAARRYVQLQRDLLQKVDELQAAAAKIAQLQKLLPICAWCKSVRTDKDYWQELSAYLMEAIDIQFTHGICPSCLTRSLSELETVQ